MNDNKTVKERYEAEPKTFALIYLDIIKERNRWRGIAAFLAATSLLLTIGIVYAAFSVKYIPYIVSVSDSGEFKGVGVLNEIKYEPKEGEIKYFLKKFITNYASLPIDPVILQNNLTELSYFVDGHANEKLQSEKLDKKIEDIGKKAISVEIISINKQSGSDNVYIARWRTKTFDNVTRKQIEKTYTGNFSITVNPSALTNEQDIVNNPLGLFVTDFSVSEENK
ncbi:VirB8/TrbF family protein [Veillonella sp. ZSJB6]|jgi:type IV secretory pathway TrbF-like protein|uniref:VirB8/TrbF family protein n=1 Tax=Veillonella sp. ZSJB6 TaxID=3451359 RepID=UPI003EE6DAD9